MTYHLVTQGVSIIDILEKMTERRAIIEKLLKIHITPQTIGQLQRLSLGELRKPVLLPHHTD